MNPLEMMELEHSEYNIELNEFRKPRLIEECKHRGFKQCDFTKDELIFLLEKDEDVYSTDNYEYNMELLDMSEIGLYQECVNRGFKDCDNLSEEEYIEMLSKDEDEWMNAEIDREEEKRRVDIIYKNREKKKKKEIKEEKRNCITGYTLKKSLGKGAFGDVKVGCLNNKCSYAVKTVKISTDKIEDKFIKEAEFTKWFYGQGFGPKYYGHCIVKDVGYIISERWDGTLISDTLSQEMYNKLKLQIDTIHKYGYIHGDVSPRNIVVKVDNKNNIKDISLIDFGEVSNTGWAQIALERLIQEYSLYEKTNSHMKYDDIKRKAIKDHKYMDYFIFTILNKPNLQLSRKELKKMLVKYNIKGRSKLNTREKMCKALSWYTVKDYKSYTIPELKETLKKRRLRVGGNKSALIKRLKDSDNEYLKAK